jgi:hypothetical protein
MRVRITIAAFAALLLAVPVGAAAPPPRKPVDAPFDPAAAPPEPYTTAAGLVGAGSAPRLGGPLAALANVCAGEDPLLRAWNLNWPFANRHNRRLLGAATLFLNGAYGGAAMPTAVASLPQLAGLAAGDQANCWRLIDTDRVRPIPREVLALVKDGTRFTVGTREVDAYAEVLTLAHFTSPEAFAKAARRDVTYANLFNDPDDYRGQVVRLGGRVRRILRSAPLPEAAAEGVGDLFEAWVFNEEFGPYPYVIVFTDWPAGLPRSLIGKERIDRKIELRFDGYFYKKFRYKAKDSREKTAREAPLLIGHSPVVLAAPAGAEPASVSDWAQPLLYVFLGLIAAVVFAVVALTYWFRRSDSRVRERLLRALSPDGLVLPPPDAVPVAPTAGAPARPHAADRQTAPAAPPVYPAARGRDLPAPGGGPKGTPPDPDEDAGA